MCSFPALSLSSPFLFGGFLCIISTSLCLLGLSGFCFLVQILKIENLIGCWSANGLAELWSGIHHRSNQGRGGCLVSAWLPGPTPPSTEAIGRGEAILKRRLWVGQASKNISIRITVLYNCAEKSF